MSYSLNSFIKGGLYRGLNKDRVWGLGSKILKGGYIWDYNGLYRDYYRVYLGNTRSFDASSYRGPV